MGIVEKDQVIYLILDVERILGSDAEEEEEEKEKKNRKIYI